MNTTHRTRKSRKNWSEAARYFSALGLLKPGMVLHHIDVDLKKKNPKRYNEWRVEDLVPMTKKEHRSLHMKIQNKRGTKMTEKHKRAISRGMRNTIHGKIRIVRKAVEADTQVFDNMAEAARYIGCSRQLVSQCLSDCQYNKTAYGYKIEVIPDELSIPEKL